MAIDTNNKKLGLMEWDQVWEPGLPLSPSTLGQDDKQQLLWGYPGVLWAVIVAAGIHDVTVTDSTVYAVGVVDNVVYGATVVDSSIYNVTIIDTLEET